MTSESTWFVVVLLAIVLVGCCTTRAKVAADEERSTTCDAEKVRIEQLETELALCHATPAEDITAPPKCGKEDDCD